MLLSISMKLFTEVFNCRYPIVALAMNRVSDLTLACAVREAGALPSISLFNYLNPTFNFKQFKQDIEYYCSRFGDGNLIISLGTRLLAHPDIFKVIATNNIKAIEYIHEPLGPIDVRRSCELLQTLRHTGVVVFFKSLIGNNVNNLIPFDGIIFKGANGAGRVNQSSITLEQALAQYLVDLPDKILIPAGGIGTAEQIKHYIGLGAAAVGIGTLFAACQESSISTETKQSMVQASHKDITKLGRKNSFHTVLGHQNALVFSRLEADDKNNTNGLVAGIESPTQGHVFAGKAIDNITEILSAHDIVQRLVSDLV